jgi:acyl-CoA thioester hydrolase
VHLESDFLYPARLDDRLRVAAYFSRFGRTSITINFDVVHLGTRRLAAAGHEVLVCTDRTNLAPRPLPEELRALFQAYALSTAEARAALDLPASLEE